MTYTNLPNITVDKIPQEVTIVRPRRPDNEVLTEFVVILLTPFLRAGAAKWALKTVGYPQSYWKVFGVLSLARIATGRIHVPLNAWSRAPKHRA